MLNNAIFHEEEVGTSSTGIVLVRDIDFAALSEETLMPFYGRCHVAYLPSAGAVLGLSKLARITKLFAKRLQTQEQLGRQVLQCLQQQLAPLGVAVVLQAKHLGFGGADVTRLTAAVSGLFAAEGSTQLEVRGAARRRRLPCLRSACCCCCRAVLASPARRPPAPLLPPRHLQELMLMLGLDGQPAALSRVAQQCTCQVCQQPGAAGAAAAAATAGPCSKPAAPAIDLMASSRAAEGLLALECGVEAPSTPDPSEGDEEAPVAEVELEGAEAAAAASSSGGSSSGFAAGPSGGNSSAAGAAAGAGPPEMEGAMRVLLREVGEDPGRPALQAAARRYVSHLLASTAGYRQRLGQQQEVAAAGQQHCSTASQAEATAGEAPAASASTSAAEQRQAAAAAAAEQIPQNAHTSSSSSRGGGDSASQAQQQQQQAQPQAAEGGVHHFDAPFASQCEHHMLPFQGSAHIAYLLPPGAPPVPPEQLAQLVAMFTRRLQLQERITHQLLHGAAQLTGAAGVMVVVEAAHMCMVARGVENHGGATLSSATLGAFSRSAPMRAAVLRRVRRRMAAQQARADMLLGVEG